ncbi:hypothetical protein EYM_07330 [Ignicoccus islandicus DSM 13165]|uniref:Peptidase S9 prolyl oligopeptidase catalytic domain-containing protein n=1 Tax=Ignicoccus islandicus DSM 13165 TaxID=940295 RepID=A0A0U2VFJ3_9CREN|nr:hypothetical protein EYM_07330 [Ignicoccus islandicus DSM 13165]
MTFHGYGSSPSRIKWLIEAFEELEIDVTAPKLPQPLVKAYEYVKTLGLDADAFSGHSMGGALSLILAAQRSKPAIAVAPPTDLSFQLEYMRRTPSLKKIYDEIASLVKIEEMVRLSPMNFRYEKPVLIIHGTDDKVVPIEQSIQFCKKIPKCKLVEINGMSHTPRKEEEITILKKSIREFVEFLKES